MYICSYIPYIYIIYNILQNALHANYYFIHFGDEQPDTEKNKVTYIHYPIAQFGF